jgi:uncharacterized protein YdhG (YjbR/CyaY superfamily)
MEKMDYESKSPEEYVSHLLKERREVVQALRKVLLENLPQELEEIMSYGMIGYVVPKSIYPDGYRANPSEPLPFVHLASQKKHIALYHMGVYFSEELTMWFQHEYEKLDIGKLDMGKSCIRLKKIDKIPYDLIAELSRKVSVKEYIDWYEKQLKK